MITFHEYGVMAEVIHWAQTLHCFGVIKANHINLVPRTTTVYRKGNEVSISNGNITHTNGVHKQGENIIVFVQNERLKKFESSYRIDQVS